MQKVHTDLVAGELVRVRGRVWRVTRVRRHDACEELHLAALPRAPGPRACTLLHPFDRPSRLARPARARAAPPRAAARVLARAAWAAHPLDGLHAAAAARIDLHAYQLEPALAVVRGLATRVLLADDVGLGKTIQAGLILGELAARGLARRALVLTPPGLRDQWVAELDRRFGLDAALVDAAALARDVARLPRGTNPWELDGIRVVSFDFIKRPEVARAIETVVWDVLIVDEAHAVSGRSDRRLAASGLARRSRCVALLTATPHAGSDAGYETLYGLGRLPHAGDDRVLVFRRTRAQAGMAGARRVKLLAVAPSEAERRMHRLLEQYTREVWREAEGGPGARLAMIVLRKRALSSAGSLAASLERRRRLLDDDAPDDARQLRLPLDADGETDDEDEAPDAALAAPGLADGARERRWLNVLAEAAAAAAAGERKIAALVRLIRRAREPAIVFTEYRDTLERIAGAIGGLAPVARLHGALTRLERAEALARFDAGEARVLLATDAAGEGLNLQARCRWVIDFELPWTPARLEQRIGRVDRLGQTRRVHALHLVARDTAEAMVVSRLVARAGRARRALGPELRVPALPEEQVAALVMTTQGAEDPGHLESRGDRGRPETTEGGASRPALEAAARSEVARASTIRAMARLARFDLTGDGGAREAARGAGVPASEARQAGCGRLRGHAGTSAASASLAGAWAEAGGPRRSKDRGDAADDAPVVCAFTARRGSQIAGLPHGAALVLVFRAAIVDVDGHRVETRLVPLALVLDGAPRTRAAVDVRATVEDVLRARAADIGARLAREQRARLDVLRAGRADALARPLARERALGATARASLARALVQPGLFDGRALARAGRERTEAAGRRAESDARVRDLEAGLRLDAGPIELVAAVVLPVAPRGAEAAT